MKTKVKQTRLVEEWKDVPEGTPVVVTKDHGEQFETKTRSMPWLLCGAAAIMVEGIAGGYSLERVRRVILNSRQLAVKIWKEAIEPAHSAGYEETEPLEGEDHEGMLQTIEGLLERNAGLKPDPVLQEARDKNDEVCI